MTLYTTIEQRMTEDAKQLEQELQASTESRLLAQRQEQADKEKLAKTLIDDVIAEKVFLSTYQMKQDAYFADIVADTNVIEQAYEQALPTLLTTTTFKNQIVQCALCLKIEQTEKFLNFYDSEFDLLIKNDFDLLMNVFFISGIMSEIRSQKLCLFFYLFLLIENNLVIYEEGKIIFSNLKLQSIQKYVEYIYDMQRNEKNIEYEFKNNLDLKKINYKNNMLYRLKNYILFKSKKEDKQYIIKKIEKNKNGLNINLIKNNLELVNKSFLKGYGAEVVVNNIIWFELIDGKNTALIGLIKRENNIIVEKFLFDRKNNNSNEGEMLLNKIKSIFDINTYLSKGKKNRKKRVSRKIC